MCVWYVEYFLIIVNVFVVNGIGGLSLIFLYIFNWIYNKCDLMLI